MALPTCRTIDRKAAILLDMKHIWSGTLADLKEGKLVHTILMHQISLKRHSLCCFCINIEVSKVTNKFKFYLQITSNGLYNTMTGDFNAITCSHSYYLEFNNIDKQ